MKIDSKMTINELMTKYPSAVGVFIKRKIPCVGCPAEEFHTIAEAAGMNGILLKHLLKDLRDVLKTGKTLKCL
jgi:hybrid cluster-associated redox disulfide protein